MKKRSKHDSELEKQGIPRYLPTREEIDAECAKIREANLEKKRQERGPTGAREPSIREVKTPRIRTQRRTI